MIEKMIVLKQKGHHEEGTMGGAAMPGMAVRLQSNGTYLQESKTGAEALKSGCGGILKEATLDRGKTIFDAYANGDRAFIYNPMPGDHLGLLVKSGQTVTVGANLVVEGTGSGLFIVAAGTEARYMATSLEASGGALAANTLIKARWN